MCLLAKVSAHEIVGIVVDLAEGSVLRLEVFG